MPRYRCFCMTEDARIITGAVIEADHAAAALDIAFQKWSGIPAFAFVQIWLGSDRLYPGNAQAFSPGAITAPGRSLGLPCLNRPAHETPASPPRWILGREVLAGGGQAVVPGAPVIAVQKAD